MSSFVIALSGGLDSTTACAYMEQVVGDKAKMTVGFKYPSKHNEQERKSARRIAEYYGLPYTEVDIGDVFTFCQSALIRKDVPVPEGHYEESNMKQTVVPGRNLIFISVLASIAESLDCGEVVLGVHAGDHAIYPDCRFEFIDQASYTVKLSTEGKVLVHAPFLYKTKADIVSIGLSLGVPYELTWTCYKGREVACGLCGSCQERLEAFEKNNTEDPIAYVTRKLLPKGN